MDSFQPNFNYVRQQAELRKLPSGQKLNKAICDVPFFVDKVSVALIFLGLISLLRVNKKAATIDRIAITNNEFSEAISSVSAKKFYNIRIPINHKQNIVAEAIRKQIPTRTVDWTLLLTPDLTPEQARINQASAGIAYSAVYPLIGVGDGGALIFSFYQYPEKIGPQQLNFMEHYSSIVSKVLRSYP